MESVRRHLIPAASLLVTVSGAAFAQNDSQRGAGPGGGADPAVALSDSALVATMAVRSIGPAVMSGRVADIAVAESPGSRGGQLGTVVYIAAATGGVWKSTNAGISWSPVFDEAGVGSVGDVTVAPSNSEIVWVGTGEANNMRSSSYGDGVYKSVDGGETFTHMGLRTSQHIGRIVIHPTNADIVYVASVGPLWGPGGDRGVFKTTDGGQTWVNTKPIDENTGFTDVVMDPANPDVLYASSLQRERRAYSYLGGGPESAIYKTTDAGETWVRLTVGLPTSDMGRIGLDVARSQPQTVYAVIEGSDGGVYRSDNWGATWRMTDDIASIPWYFGQIRVDPNDPETVYHLGQRLSVSRDGGQTWSRIAGNTHADHHSLWINPENSDHIIDGNDGGLYISRDKGVTWDFSPDLPISQFYTVGMDMQEPFFGVYGGLQDNSTWGGPSRSRQRSGIVNADWIRMAGGDGFYAAVDPTDHNIAYVESQNGNLLRYDRRTGEQRPIRPQPGPGEDPYRFNWSAPIQISPFDHNTVYFAANFLFKSTNRGDAWTRLGDDLTRAIDRDSLPMMGSIPNRRAVARHSGTARFGNISTIAVSTLREGLLVTGSDDGVVGISLDDGQTWERVESFPGVPDTTYVSRVVTSMHDQATIYVTLDGHRSNDFNPYVMKSTDFGDNWQSISSNLPEFGSVRAIHEHHRNPNLLFVGTEIAPFVSTDGGGSWTRISNGMPPAPVHSLKTHERDNALVIATHGRGFYLIDDLAPLEQLAEAKRAEVAHLFPVKSQLLFVPNNSATSGTRADRDYSGENPPVGTTISYLLQQNPPEDGLELEIVDPDGDVVRKLDPESTPGLHHVLWDFRLDPSYSGPPDDDPPQQQQFGGGGGGNQGPLTLPGAYTARLTVETQEDDEFPVVLEQQFTAVRDEMVLLSDAELRNLFTMRKKVADARGALTIALRSADDLKAQVTQAKEAAQSVDGTDGVLKEAARIETEVDDIICKLRGPARGGGFGGGGFGGGGGGSNECEEEAEETEDQAAPAEDTRTVQQRLDTANGINRATANPTEYEVQAFENVPADLEREVGRLNALLGQMPAFFVSLDAADVPWTPGRPVRVNIR